MKDKKKFTQAWFIRRAAYAIVGIVLLVLAGFGLIEESQIDTIAASPILGALVAFVASAKTNPGSDSTVTAKDVEQAAKPDHADIAKQVAEYFQPAGKHAVDVATDTVNKAATSVSEYYNDRSS